MRHFTLSKTFPPSANEYDFQSLRVKDQQWHFFYFFWNCSLFKMSFVFISAKLLNFWSKSLPPFFRSQGKNLGEKRSGQREERPRRLGSVWKLSRPNFDDAFIFFQLARPLVREWGFMNPHIITMGLIPWTLIPYLGASQFDPCIFLILFEELWWNVDKCGMSR